MKVLIPSSAGDLIDRITILEVKKLCFKDAHKLKNIVAHLKELKKIHATLPRTRILKDLQKKLFEVNKRQWELEDAVRIYLRDKKINASFAKLVHGIHLSNDKRASIKRDIDMHTGSYLVDEKHYAS